MGSIISKRKCEVYIYMAEGVAGLTDASSLHAEFLWVS